MCTAFRVREMATRCSTSPVVTATTPSIHASTDESRSRTRSHLTQRTPFPEPTRRARFVSRFRTSADERAIRRNPRRHRGDPPDPMREPTHAAASPWRQAIVRPHRHSPSRTHALVAVHRPIDLRQRPKLRPHGWADHVGLSSPTRTAG